MTDVMERLTAERMAAMVPVILPGVTIGSCTAERHGSSWAWRMRGCRCPGAALEQTAFLIRRHNREYPRSNPACPALRHLTYKAYGRDGCRCPEAFESMTKHIAALRARPCRSANLASAHTFWRGPQTRVNPISVLMLTTVPPCGQRTLRGFWDEATRRERMLAVDWLSRVGNRAGTGRLEDIDIGARMGVSGPTVSRYRTEYRRLRERRTERRLADSRWRNRKDA